MEVTYISSPLHTRAVVVSSLAIQKPSRLSHRKNHLRPKILKTLSPNPPPAPVTIATPLTYDVDEDSSFVEPSSAAETFEGDEFQTSSAVLEESLVLGKFSTKSMLKFGAYLIGVFLFQTICAVWFLGSDSTSSRSEKPKDSESDAEEKDNIKSLINGNVRRGFSHGKIFPETGNAALYLYDSEVEKKIQEIRLMAREARRTEAKKLKDGPEGGQMEEEGPASKSRIVIEKEIGSRLKKLEKKLKSVKKSPASSKDVSGSKEAGNGLVFKKKLKYRGASVGKSSQSPKGFGSENHNYQELQSDGVDLENGKNKPIPQKRIKVEDTENTNGPLQKISQESYLSEAVDSGSLREVSPGNSRSFGSIKDSAKKSLSPSIRRQKDDTAHFCDQQLPVLYPPLPSKNSREDVMYDAAILMRQGSNHEGPEGLFTLKIASEKAAKGVYSYIIGFEDRVDANNFCNLLESFFEDLGDFSTDVVPLLRKELQAAVKAETMKIFVLRKGKLQLYAGQPFSDVESDLVSLVKENESAYR